jgi:hypothetical protein
VEKCEVATSWVLLLNEIKYALDVQIHHLGEGGWWVAVELFTPGGTGIGEENVDVVGRLAHLSHQAFQFGRLGAVGGHRDRLRTRALVGERIQCRSGFFACLGLARADVDLGAAGLEEAARCYFLLVMYVWLTDTYPLAV